MSTNIYQESFLSNLVNLDRHYVDKHFRLPPWIAVVGRSVVRHVFSGGSEQSETTTRCSYSGDTVASFGAAVAPCMPRNSCVWLFALWVTFQRSKPPSWLFQFHAGIHAPWLLSTCFGIEPSRPRYRWFFSNYGSSFCARDSGSHIQPALTQLTCWSVPRARIMWVWVSVIFMFRFSKRFQSFLLLYMFRLRRRAWCQVSQFSILGICPRAERNKNRIVWLPR